MYGCIIRCLDLFCADLEYQSRDVVQICDCQEFDWRMRVCLLSGDHDRCIGLLGMDARKVAVLLISQPLLFVREFVSLPF